MNLYRYRNLQTDLVKMADWIHVHTTVSPECQQYEDNPTNVVMFQGKENPISNLFAFGEHHQSAGHNNPNVTQKVKESESTLDAKRISQK